MKEKGDNFSSGNMKALILKRVQEREYNINMPHVTTQAIVVLFNENKLYHLKEKKTHIKWLRFAFHTSLNIYTFGMHYHH